jgi:CheY-like chemotaxis protein
MTMRLSVRRSVTIQTANPTLRCGEAENGQEAIEKAQLHPDLIVLDLSMPDERYRRRPRTEKVDAYGADHYL